MKLAITALFILVLLSPSSHVFAVDNNQFSDSKVSFSLPQGWILGEVAAIKKTAKGLHKLHFFFG